MNTLTKKHLYFPIIALVGVLFVVTVLIPKSASAVDSSAVGFDAGNIIDDYTLTNTGTMSVGQIQSFLSSNVPNCDTNGTQASEYGGGTRAQWAANQSLHPNIPAFYPPFTCLKDYSQNGSSAAQIIYNIAQAYNINPQVLIVVLQKEQGLVTDTWPGPHQYKTATGYGCPDTAACDSQYFGFTNQLTNTAKMFHAIEIASPTWYTPYILGNNTIQYNPTASCGSSVVNIQNRATQALYNYTPYQPNAATLNAPMGTTVSCGAYGNLNFYRYFTQWFGTTQSTLGRAPLTSKATNVLSSGMQLKPGEFLTSPNGLYVLVMQPSGQLVLYQSKQAVWEPGGASWSNQGASLTLQSDGNLVLSKNSTVIWNSATSGQGVTKLSLQNDGNLVLYTAANQAVWASDTSQVHSSRSLKGSSLASGARLAVGDYLRSSDWRYYLIMQSDGNLVLYTAGYTQAIWSSRTGGLGGKYVSMQSDGNLVMYGDKGAVWASNTNGRAQSSSLSLQSDGNLVLYNTALSVLWASNTNGLGGKYVSMQSDGNLVMYGDKGAVWASNTNGLGGKYVSMQSDGNLVMYGDKGAVWASNTNGRAQSSVAFSCTYSSNIQVGGRVNSTESICSSNNLYKLTFQSDGNLVLYLNTTAASWATNSNGQFFKSNLDL